MTTIHAEDIIDAEVLGRAAALRARVAEKAKAGAARSGAATKRGLRAGVRRLGRGLAGFPTDLVAYWSDVDGALDVAEAAAGDPTTKAKGEHETAKRRHRANVVGFVLASLGWCSAGWTALAWTVPGPGGWGVVVGWWLITVGVAGLASVAVWRGKHKDGWLWPSRLLGAVAVAGIGLFAHLAGDLAAWQMSLIWLVPVLGWLTWAASDGEVFGDGTAPIVAEDATKALDPAAAAAATKRLPQDVAPALVAPGVVWGNQGMIWTATLDTGGASATVLLEPKTKAEFAARLGLSARRLVLTVDEDRGSRLHVTGIVGQPWKDGVRHPLLAMQPVDLWSGVPWGVTLEGDVVRYRIEGHNALFGGESGAGKSTALAGVWAAFALAVHQGVSAEIHVIDGGEVDTEPLRRSGLASAWTTDLGEGVGILKAVLAEVDRRQHLLAAAELRKVSPEFFAQHGLGFLLLGVDELATFTQRKGSEAAEFAETLRLIAQRARKTGVHLLLSTQSPSVDALDADARDVIPVRWCGRARSVDLAGKVLGRGAVGRGLDPRDLPDIEGVGWYSAPKREVVVRPYNLTDSDLRAVCARGVELRQGSRVETAADDDRVLADRVAGLIKAEGYTVPQGRVMPAREVASRLEVDQMQLRAALGRIGVTPSKVSRPDDTKTHGHMHYVLSDLPATRAV